MLKNTFIKLVKKVSEAKAQTKIIASILTVMAVGGTATGTYVAKNKNNSQSSETSVVDTNEIEYENDIGNEIGEGLSNEISNEILDAELENELADDEPAEVEKEVTYQNKKIEIPKAKVAPQNSAEDSQKVKTGGETISAQEAVKQFENDGQSIGIDVSAHQGKIDWAQVKAQGIEFAMIRCGFRGQSAGQIYQDKFFKDNVTGATKNGIFVGIYFYSTAINEDEALQEAAWVVNAIKSYRITYPVAYDFEDFGKYRCVNVDGNQATNNANAFLGYVCNAGYTPMMYANKNDITSRFNKGKLPYKFWLAHYTTATNYTGSYQMWQRTSNGSVSGISGRVDMDIAYFRFSAFAEPKHVHDFANGTIINTSDSKPATCTENGRKYIRCKDCSESQEVEIPATGHNFEAWKTEKAATTEKPGIETRKCKNCGYVETKEIPKLPKKNEGKSTQNTQNNNTANNSNTTDSATNTTTNKDTNNTAGNNNTSANAEKITENTENKNNNTNKNNGGNSETTEKNTKNETSNQASKL